ncbi:MAG: glucosaminidase domain-containing protein [Ferrovibrio sp.]|jgi:Bax protein|uniref:glucosaminidase domain-containing protein n=1 Tax=Ferrovibrio sp. TaxID=1917215 RepID=UPI00391D61F2
MTANRDRRLLAIGSDVRLILAGFGLLLAVGLVSGIGVGLLSSRQLARVPDVQVQQTASLGDGVNEAWDRLRQIALLDWRAVVEPRAVADAGRKSSGNAESESPDAAAVNPAEASRRVAEVRQFSPHRTALRAQTDRTVDAMLRKFEQEGFDLADMRNASGQLEVPRIFLASLPIDIADVNLTEKRKRAFMKVMLPHILRENERILANRERVERLHERLQRGATLTARDDAWLRQISDQYGLDDVDTAELLNRIDIVPPALALAQSIEESGWGTSRFALLGNAVFGQWTWTPGSGIVPENRPDGETYEVQRFRSLEQSVAAYMRNLNSKSSYREFRDSRASMRSRGEDLDSYRLAGHLHRYSVRGADYIRTIRSIMKTNTLEMFDGARLADEPSPLFTNIDYFGKS